MKIKLTILQKPATVNPQDKVVLGALHQMGYAEVTGLRIGRFIEIEVDDTLSAQEWETKLRLSFQKSGDALFPNPVMENYAFCLKIICLRVCSPKNHRRNSLSTSPRSDSGSFLTKPSCFGSI